MRKRHLLWAGPLAAVVILGLNGMRLVAQQGDALKEVLKEEAKRVAVVEKVRPSVVAIFDKGFKGGGSGVLISKDGYAVTNFHVVKPSGALMKCGLDNGELYDAVVCGWDMVGDVAVIKLVPNKAGEEFPCSVMGDSDTVKLGDWSLAMGNPFLLATDFTPTVTFGMVSGVHRYQPPEGKGFLEYTDCIQIDTSINPGNSGGPLFNMKGELIGINGRGSFDKRGRVNSGVGYAISINQIKHFMGHLKGGLSADHATLGAVVTTQTQKDGSPSMLFTTILDDSDVQRRGLDYNDELISFDARPVNSVNQFKNVLGIFPRGWRLPMVYRCGPNTKSPGALKEILVRLQGATAKELQGNPDGKKIDSVQVKQPPQPPQPVDQGNPAAKYYQPKKGFVNYYFNKLEKDRLLDAFKKTVTYKSGADWAVFGNVKLGHTASETKFKVDIKDPGSVNPKIVMTVSNFDNKVSPLDSKTTTQELQLPGKSGGLAVALYEYHRLMSMGEKGFTKCEYAGRFPYYPPLPNGKTPSATTPPTSWQKVKTVADVIETEDAVYKTRWYFSPEDQKLVAFEVTITLGVSEDNPNPPDPCEVYLTYDAGKGVKGLPSQMQVRYADTTYGTLFIENVDVGAGK